MPYSELKSVQVLVTGGAGFIGSHLVDALLESGARVRVLDDLSTGSLENLAQCRDRIEWIEGDIRNARLCRQACRGAAFVFHQAALGSVPRSMQDPATSLAVNVQGTANILAAAANARVSRVIYASSSSVYGDSVTLPKRVGEEGSPQSPYAASKQMSEDLAEVFDRCFDLPAVGLRYFNVYGPRQNPEGPYAAVIPRFFKACYRHEPLHIHGDGEQSRDFTYVRDAVEANLLAVGASQDVCSGAFNVAVGKRTTINDLARAIRQLIGNTGSETVHGPPRPGDVRHSLADLEMTRKNLGYEPRYDLEQGLAAAEYYYRELFATPMIAP